MKKIGVVILGLLLLFSLNVYPFYSIKTVDAQSTSSETSSASPERVVFFDDFESYAVGRFPSAGGWEIIWNGKGDEYQYVSDLYSFSPTKSLHLWGQAEENSCVVQRRFSSNAPVIGYEFAIFFNSRGAGYQDHPAFFKKGAEGQVWGTYYATVIFDHQDGKIKAEDGTILGDWTPKTWYKVRVVLDRTSKTYSVWINGDLKGQNLKIKMEHPELIDAIALTSGWPGAEVYYDDVKVFEGSPSQLQTGGAPPAVTGEPVIFIGSVENVGNEMLTLKVRKIVSGAGLQEGKSIDVFYNSTSASVLLGAVSKGDEVQVYGESSQGSVENLSTLYGLVNLKYLQRDQVSKIFGSTDTYSWHKPLNFDTGIVNIGFSLDASAELSLSMGLSGNYYGACRNGTAGLLNVVPVPGSGSFSLTISATVSVNDESRTFQKNWGSSLDMGLGKPSDITFERIPVPFDITVATVEVGITPIITFEPASFFMSIDSTGSLYFPKETVSLTASKQLTWSTHNYREIHLIFKGDDGSAIKATSCLVYEISLKVKLDANIKTLLGEKKVDLGTFTLYQYTGAKELEPKDVEIAEFQPYYLLTLQMPNSSMTASINQKMYNADEHGKIVTLLKRGKYNVEVPEMKMIANGERLRFLNWNNSITDNVLDLALTRDTFLVPVYRKQFYLHITSIVKISGEGWYDENTSVVLDATSKNATEQDGVRYLFVEWEGYGPGSYTGNSPKISIVMKSPINETIVWKKQFKLTVISTEHGTSEPQPGTYWFDVNSTVTLTAKPDQGYEAKQWRVDDIIYEGSTLTLKKDGPHTVKPIVFQATQEITETAGGVGSLTWLLVVVAAVITVVLVVYYVRKSNDFRKKRSNYVSENLTGN